MCDSQKSREKFQTLFLGSGHESTFIVTCRLGLGATPPQDLTARVYQIQLETRVQRKVLGKGRNHQDIEIGTEVHQCDHMYIHTHCTYYVHVLFR